jgi:maltose-binding protein MalE
MARRRFGSLTRREVIRRAAALGLVVAAPAAFIGCGDDDDDDDGDDVTPPGTPAGNGTPAADGTQAATRDIAGTELRIVQWSHFVPRYDEWFDPFAQEWAEANDVNLTVDHINVADLPATFASEISAGQGHDLWEDITPRANLEPSLVDLTDIHDELIAEFGDEVELCRQSTFNPTTNVYWGLAHGWAPDPGDYRKSLWEQVGFPDGPATWDELLEGGSQIREELGVQMGIGMSNEIDSNMAGLALMWSFGGQVQDEEENLTINSSETIDAVDYMAQLFEQAMTPEVFSWNAASNNQLIVAGQASYILNSISAYRTAQQAQPEVADDIFFTRALEGPAGSERALANVHAIPIYMVPTFSDNSDTAKEFILHLVRNYRDACMESELYNFPAWTAIFPELYDDGGPLDEDPFGSNPADKLSVLKTAEEWTTNTGYPGPTNAAIGEMFGTFVIPAMYARAARGELSPEEAVEEAEAALVPIYENWRRDGLIGGGNVQRLGRSRRKHFAVNLRA